MLKGKKPDSARLKLVKGGDRSGRINYNEPIPPPPDSDAPLKAPPHLCANSARKLWDHYAPLLEDQGILTINDTYTFGTLCNVMAECAADPLGFDTARLAQMRMLLELFGMAGPSSRARLQVEQKSKIKKARNKAASYFNA